jgi:hypothetical protein
MKRYISSILVPSFLLQLFGCYSYKDITSDELQKYNGPNDVRIKTNQNEVVINRKSTFDNRMNWEANDSSIIVKTIEPITLEDYNKLSNKDYNKSVSKKMEIKFNEIVSVEIDDLNVTTTVLLLVGIGAFIALAAAVGSAPGAGL